MPKIKIRSEELKSTWTGEHTYLGKEAAAALTENEVRRRFAHFLAEGSEVERFLLPGSHAINFLLHEVLGGGGVASIRNDPQGKGYAQILLATPIPVPGSIAETL